MTKTFLLAAVVMTGVLTAGSASADLAWSGSVRVSKVDIENIGGSVPTSALYLTFNTPPMTTQCSLTGNTFIVNGGDADGVKGILSIALAAKLSATSVRVLFSNSYQNAISCSGGGTVGYPVLRGLEAL
jgi:hypothetical protein